MIYWCLLILLFISLIYYIYCLTIKLSYGICKCSQHLIGKVAIVTGSNVGIGFETAKDFAFRGAKVILACRTEHKGLKAKEEIIAATGNRDVYYYHLDLASLQSIRDFTDKVKNSVNKLDILVNNEGDLDVEMTATKDGLLRGMQVNFFGPFLLTNLLLPLLKSSAPSRIINVASIAYRLGRINLQDLNETGKYFGKIRVYSNAKLCSILTTVELKRRLEKTRVTVNALCPGFVAKNVFSRVENPLWRKMFELKLYFMSKDSWYGAQTAIYLAVSPEVKGVSGQFFTDCKQRELESFAKDPKVAKKLWKESEKLVQLNDFDKEKLR